VLDDLKYLHQRDAHDALGSIEKEWLQIQEELLITQDAVTADAIVVVGMGSSGIAGQLAKTWLGPRVPFEIVQDFDLPQYVSAQTYVIITSYSGDDEEALSALGHAENSNAQIVVITSGGKLADRAKQQSHKTVLLQPMLRSAYSVLAVVRALSLLLGTAHLITNLEADEQLRRAAGFVEKEQQQWLPTVSMKQNLAKQIALDTLGLSAIIYSGPQLAAIAYRWKIGFNQAAKQLAWTGEYPAVSYAELLGWTDQPVDKPFKVIELRSNFEHPSIQKQATVTEQLLSGRRPAPLVVEAQGPDLISHLLWTLILGDFVTAYTALANGNDPLQRSASAIFKEKMKE
jgi:glucose/mannose-6-phosphate isomerase